MPEVGVHSLVICTVQYRDGKKSWLWDPRDGPAIEFRLRLTRALPPVRWPGQADAPEVDVPEFDNPVPAAPFDARAWDDLDAAVAPDGDGW